VNAWLPVQHYAASSYTFQIPQQMAHGPVGHPGPQGYDDTQDCCCTIQ
jgi:hypothetical protein